MKQGAGSSHPNGQRPPAGDPGRKQEVGKAAPVRGTQSFVGVMAEVWKRPGLVGIEILWRWAFGVVMLGLVWWKAGAMIVASWASVGSWAKILMHGGFVMEVDPKAAVRDGLVALGLSMAWAVVSALGRCVTLPRLEGELKAKWGEVAVLAMMRVLSLWVVMGGWVWILVATVQGMVYAPLARGDEPSYVPGFAIVVGATLVLFVVWCLVSWVLQLAPLVAMGRGVGVVGSLRGALAAGALRGKLIEINLVMGIVKVCLVVLAMVFSACPLPFSSVETQEFLNWWWAGVAVFYLVFSDYFHVVRVAAYLRLAQAYGVQGIGDRG